MIVSWNWLKEYVRLDMPVETLTERLMMAGLNLEEVTDVQGDLAIDLEVTSNRPDCLGHLGIARETAALFHREWQLPKAQPAESGPAATQFVQVINEVPELCPQYFARVVRGVKVGPSPDWLVRRLQTLGIRPVNNVVDITNYVLMECGQPLHAFDCDQLQGEKIVIRCATAGEKMVAIDQREYELRPGMCVIADASRPVAIAGVMGGQSTEIGPQTRNVLIEVAEFAPLSVRNTSRLLNLRSDSSYRFERGVDRHNLDWASRRCAELILEICGGELCVGSVFAGDRPTIHREPVVLRYSQLRRILGIDVPREEVLRILVTLGLEQTAADDERCQFLAPSWRRDLTREIDLVEEVARIHGYEEIPEGALVPIEVSSLPLGDQVTDRAATVLTAAGFFEAVTLTFVSQDLANLFNPWTTAPPLSVDHSSRRQENLLRQSLVPSLLQARRHNERHGTFNAQLFEVAKIYLAAEPDNAEAEPTVLAFVSSRSFAEMRGVIDAIVRATNRAARVTARPADVTAVQPGRGAELLLDGRPWGWMGELSLEARQQLGLADPVTVVEVRLAELESVIDLAPVFHAIPEYPAIERDLNFVLDETVSWQELEEVVRQAAGDLLETVRFESQYRGPQIAADKKSYVLRLQYRAADRTLTAEEVDQAQLGVIAACQSDLQAIQR